MEITLPDCGRQVMPVQLLQLDPTQVERTWLGSSSPDLNDNSESRSPLWRWDSVTLCKGKADSEGVSDIRMMKKKKKKKWSGSRCKLGVL